MHPATNGWRALLWWRDVRWRIAGAYILGCAVALALWSVWRYVPAKPVVFTPSREARKGLVAKLRYDSPVPAPVKAGQRLGTLEIAAPGMATHAVPLLAGSDVARAGVLGRIAASLAYLVHGAS